MQQSTEMRGCRTIFGQKAPSTVLLIRSALQNRRPHVRSSRVIPRTAAPSVEATELAAPPVDAKTPLHTTAAQEQQQKDSGTFSWTKQWWPVAPVSYLDPTKPAPVTMLGHTYVVWFDPKAQSWRVMEDRCPHRLAPLSEGRIDEDGTLMCSYHGWQFSGSGACTRIPQIGDPAKMQAACSAPRACVASFPTTVLEGVLFAWLESGPQAEAEAAASPPYVMPELAGSDNQWGMTEQPVDYTFWLEQGMDPTHANFLHHTCGFPMSDALAMPGEVLAAKEVDLKGGYLWKHGNYSKKHAGMQAERQFVPPNQLRVVYDKGFVRGFATMGVPVRPGVSRVFGRFQFGTTGKKAPLLFRLLGKLPHWVRLTSPLADQDTVVNAKQETYMRSQGLTPKDYAAFAHADQGVVAAHRWFDAAGYEQMWQQRLGRNNNTTSSSSSAAAATGGAAGGARYAFKPYTAPTKESQYFDWYERHTKHCAECLAGMKRVGQLANAAAVAALLFVVAAASLAVAAKTVWSPGVALCALIAGAAVWMRRKLAEFRHTQFINSNYRWQKDGGLSLVKGDPIKLYG